MGIKFVFIFSLFFIDGFEVPEPRCSCTSGSCRGLPCWFIWRYKSVCHSCQEGDYHAKGHSACQANSWRKGVVVCFDCCSLISFWFILHSDLFWYCNPNIYLLTKYSWNSVIAPYYRQRPTLTKTYIVFSPCYVVICILFFDVFYTYFEYECSDIFLSTYWNFLWLAELLRELLILIVVCAEWVDCLRLFVYFYSTYNIFVGLLL